MKYKVVFEKGEDSFITATCPAITGCISQGKTVEEAAENIKEAIKLSLECYKEDGIPAPSDVTIMDIAV